MAAVHRGFGATIGIGIESNYGTPVARTNWLKVLSTGLRRTRTKTPIGTLGVLGGTNTLERDFLVESDFAGGPISVPVSYNDSTVLLGKFILGNNAESGAGPFTHTQVLTSPIPAPLTIEQISGTPATGNMTEVFTSVLINSATYTFEAGKVAMLDLDCIAQTSGGLVAAGTPTYNATREFVLPNALTTLQYNSATVALKSLKITVGRNLQRNLELGSLLTQIPVEDRVSVDIDATVLWQSSSHYAAYLADTQAALSVVFTGTSSRSLTIIGDNVLVVDRSAPVNAAGGIQETIKLRPFASAASPGLTMAWVNGNALFSAN